jgi:uncharacterized membrane protein
MSFWKNEPAVLIGMVTAIIVAGIGLLTAFGINVSQEQAGAITGLVGALMALVLSFITRSKVTPVNPEPPAHPEV